ncbi:hypothetical protein GQ55_9G083200 [Panicum hallii var. hallii]|uniref:Uncharacterized protein n=1 Tax=Panicum hallii var. hallii TaxID=1504633 RepID=A0A2T7C0X9_9POAL|nr:hypothetical protein GQ55_9G083200 [Panicum hallii var. hallii]
MAMSPLLTLHLLVLATTTMAPATPPTAHFLGVSYGTLGDNLPPPPPSGSTTPTPPSWPRAAAALGLVFVPSIPNELIPSLAASQHVADAWFSNSLLPFRRSSGLPGCPAAGLADGGHARLPCRWTELLHKTPSFVSRL